MRKSALTVFWKDKRGGHTIEYALIVALIVVGLLAAINAIGNSTRAMYENLDSEWDAAQDG